MPSILETSDDVRDKDVDEKLLRQVKNGANWFYWIAGLSLLNSAIFLYGGDITFIAGLGITQLIDALLESSVQTGATSYIQIVAMGVNFIFVAMFAFTGYYAGKSISAAFLIGIVIYSLDTILLVFLDSLFPVLFHVFALTMIVIGYIASRKVSQKASGLPI